MPVNTQVGRVDCRRCRRCYREGLGPHVVIEVECGCDKQLSLLEEPLEQDVNVTTLLLHDVIGAQVEPDEQLLSLRLVGLEPSDIQDLARRLAGWRPKALRGQL